jgi:hypothetical protein
MEEGRQERRIKRSLILDADLDRWIERKALAERVSDSHIVRRYLRAAMDAESRITDADTEQ